MSAHIRGGTHVRLLVTVDWSPRHLAGIKAAYPQVEFVTALTDDDATRAIADAEIVFGRLSRETFLAAKKLRWIQSHGAGVEFVGSIPELIASDVTVTNTRGGHAATIAEHTIGMLISLARGFQSLDAAQREAKWLRPLGFEPVGLAGRTMGIIGLGNIGRAIAKRAHAFEMTVIAVDAVDAPAPDYVAARWGLDRLPELLGRSDVVVVAVPLTAETRGMLGPAQFAQMKEGAFLLAISRGGIVDERSLASALKEGRLAGAGLDVQSREPLPADDPLWQAPRLLLTPHCSGMSELTTDSCTEIFKDNLGRYLAGQPLTNLIDKSRGF
jgi:phosphoglycerate dehydrogenase-like enzyme